MGTKVNLQMDPTDKILLRRKLNKNGDGQRFFTHEVRRLSTQYIPRLTGYLAEDSVTESVDHITYNAPYARRQWFENKGNGLRGPRWTERMWPDRGKEIVKATAAYCGGKAK